MFPWPVLLLVAARLLPMCLLGPLLGGPAVPALVRLGVAAVLVGAIAPALASTPVPADLVAAVVAELVLGAVLAVVAAAPIWGARAAGSLLDADGEGPLASFHELFAVALFFALGGHLVLVGALGATFVHVPLGGGVATGAALTAVLGATARVFEAALALAAPALLARLFVDLGAALAGRASGAPVAGALAGVRMLSAVAALAVALTAIALALRGELTEALRAVAAWR